MGRFFALFALDEFQIRETFEGWIEIGESEYVARNDDNPGSLEELLQQLGFCRLSGRPAGLTQLRRPIGDRALGNIMVNRVIRYWLAPDDHELVPVYLRENGRLKAALHNDLVWLPISLRQAELVAWYLQRKHMAPGGAGEAGPPKDV
jgi:hypothetical protein